MTAVQSLQPVRPDMRLYGGIHYRPAIARGLEQGRCVGQAVSSLEFRRRRGRERKD
jgi:hypothetical protein